MNTVCTKNMCAGCMACVDVCPKQAIEIKDTLGEYNAVIDESKCVGCSLCHKKCQVNHTPILRKPIKWFDGWANDPIRKNSSSGGVATTLMSSFDGVVCSCIFRQGEFVFEFDDGDRSKYAGSKYVKSNPKGVYKRIQKILSEGEKVLFIGLPCQCAAIINYTECHERLYTVDLICHGTPSPQLLNFYLSERNLDIKEIKDLKFRKKDSFGLFHDGIEVEQCHVKDLYTIAFLNNLDYTENCYSCQYARLERVGDITIGDSWASEESAIEKNKGVSLILCHTQKGVELISKTELVLKNTDLSKAIAVNHQLAHPSIEPKERKRFFSELKNGFSSAMRRAYPKYYYKQRLKRLLLKLGLLK